MTATIDFNEVIDRTQVATLKVDGATIESVFGQSDLWPSWVADMDFRASDAIRLALQKRLDHGVFGYEVNDGAVSAAVARWYQHRHRWTPSTDHLLFTPRTLASIAMLIKLFSKEGDGVIVQPPVFYDFKIIIKNNQRQLVKNPLQFSNGVYQMDFDHLEHLAADAKNSLLILCNPHNPIGRVWSREDLLKIAEICARHDVFVISDEIHGDITYETAYTPFASVSELAADNSATCLSPIKSFNLAGVANSMIVIKNEERRQACKQWLNAVDVNKNNVFASAAMLAAYDQSEEWLDQVLDYLRANVELLNSYLRDHIPDIRLIEPEGTYLAWLDCRSLNLTVEELQDFLVGKAKFAANPGHWFGREGAGFVRINFACPRSRLEGALQQLRSAVGQLPA